MEDEAIICLYWQRDEGAIRETREKYGNYLGQKNFVFCNS